MAKAFGETIFYNEKIGIGFDVIRDLLRRVDNLFDSEISVQSYLNGGKLISEIYYRELVSQMASVLQERSLSFLSPAVAREWHPYLNFPLTPDSVSNGTHTKVWWKCSKGHDFEASVKSRTGKSRSGCPYCSGNRVLPETSLAKLYPRIAREIHPTKNGTIDPNVIAAKSHKRLFWQCREYSSHVWVTTVAHRTSGTGCPKCAQRARNKK